MIRTDFSVDTGQLRIRKQITSWILSRLKFFAALSSFPSKTDFCAGRPFIFIGTWSWYEFWLDILNKTPLLANNRSRCVDCYGSFVSAWTRFVRICVTYWVFFSKGYQGTLFNMFRTVLGWTWRLFCIDFGSAVLFANNSKFI